MKCTFFLAALIVSTAGLSAQEKDYFDMTLEELLNVEVSVATQNKLSAKESPGIISYITSDQIKVSGARDLLDVLRMVPGFDFNVTTWGAVIMSARGIADNGNVSFLMDGFDLTERLYSDVYFGNHYDINQIERIEIIRGPGSVLYGGTAELAVINVITKKATDFNGGNGTVAGGLMSKTYGRANVSGSYAYSWDTDVNAFAHVFFGNANRSDRTYTDYYGTSYAMKNNSGIQTYFLNGGASIGNFSFQIIVDQYNIQERDHYGITLPKKTTNHFHEYLGSIKYKIHGQKWSITPSATYSHQTPWWVNNKTLDNEVWFTNWKANSDRLSMDIVASYDLNNKTNILAGANGYRDWAKYFNGSYGITGQDLSYRYWGVAAFAQIYNRNEIANVTLGIRIDKHSEYGTVAVPRLALTKVMDQLHLKALYSRAFRAPGLEALRFSNGKIKPEYTTAYEFETGYQWNKTLSTTVNIYDVMITDPMAYVYENNKDNYRNFGRFGTRGIEIMQQYKSDLSAITFGFSHYVANKKSDVKNYQVIDYTNANPKLVNEQANLGVPQSKLSFNGLFKVKKDVRISTTWVWYSSRYGYDAIDLNGNLVPKRYDPVHMLDIYVSYKSLGVGVYNIYNSKYNFLMAYNGGHPPYPGMGREVYAKYEIKF
ncbi:MAG TPA: TonB-dependent receptor plug domain-containing protein [bacterium]|nr:TonB-dependent receptor plug domain-containing protein [bacterium]